jgi:hypothetical protein
MAKPPRNLLRIFLLLGLCLSEAVIGQDAGASLQDLPTPPPQASAQNLPEPPPPVAAQDLPEPPPITAQDLPEPPPPIAVQDLPQPPPEVTVTHVSLGSHVDSHLKTPVPKTIFKPVETLYVSVDTHTTGTGSVDGTLGVLWTFGSGNELQSVSDSSEELVFHGDQTTEFHVSKPDRWPEGQYQAEVFLNGASVYRTTFTVR